jgi:DNA-binding GntR family transcriptional regulator
MVFEDRLDRSRRMMSAMDPPLHERIYAGIKQDYRAGHFVPGKRIDIQELATRHRSSKTPVREAAFILVGEGLLTHHADGGFLVPVLDPSDLIELLEWHMQLLLALLSTLKNSAIHAALARYTAYRADHTAVSVANLATDIFASMASASRNHEAASEVRRVNERLHYSRISDFSDPAAAEKELVTLTSLDVVNLRKATRRRVEIYHMRKIADLQGGVRASPER